MVIGCIECVKPRRFIPLAKEILHVNINLGIGMLTQMMLFSIYVIYKGSIVFDLVNICPVSLMFDQQYIVLFREGLGDKHLLQLLKQNMIFLVFL